MRRSDTLIKVITLVVFIAIAVYIGYYIYYVQVNPLKTVLATTYVGGDFVSTEGYAVRDETVICGSGGNISVTASDGEKISAGQSVAVEYKNSGAADRSDDITALQLRIDQLNTMLKDIGSGGSIKVSAYDSVTRLSSAVGNGDFEDIDRLTAEIDSFIFADTENYTSSGIRSEIASCQDQLESLKKTASSDTVYISSGTSGTFSSNVDGLENITPEDIEDLSVSAYSELFKDGKTAANAVGKLCGGTTWYYVTLVPAELAPRLRVGRDTTISFTKNYNATLKMKVVSVSAEEDGKCVAVFSTNKYLPEVVSIRELSADIVFSTYSGIRVPKEAVHVDDEGKYIYLLTGVQSRRADIEIICESGDYYIVESLDKAVFHEGSEIIIKANDLYDGKVVETGIAI